MYLAFKVIGAEYERSWAIAYWRMPRTPVHEVSAPKISFMDVDTFTEMQSRLTTGLLMMEHLDIVTQSYSFGSHEHAISKVHRRAYLYWPWRVSAMNLFAANKKKIMTYVETLAPLPRIRDDATTY